MRLAYLRFCLYFGRTPMPADNLTILAYTVFLARTLKPTSISGYLNYVRLLHTSNGLDNPLEGHFNLELVKRGISRVHGMPPKQKLPITPRVLLDIYSKLDMDISFHVTFWACCLVAFFSFSRKSTLLPRSKNDIDDKTLRLSDLGFSCNGTVAVITVRHSKTIQFGQRILKLHLQGSTSLNQTSVLDPVSALKRSISRFPDAADTALPLFSYVRKNGSLSCLTYNSFVTCLKEHLRKAGYDPNVYSGHSFRRGGCTFAFQLGISPSLIKLRGDWRSNAYERYIFISDSLNMQVGKALYLAATDIAI